MNALNTKGLKHRTALIRMGLFGMGVGALLDMLVGSFPLWTGVAFTTAELATYGYLRLRYGADA